MSTSAAAATEWPSFEYADWAATCDTLHGHLQVLGKLGVALAPAEPELQHSALRLTPRGWETSPLPAPDGSGAFTVTVDLHSHETVVNHSDGRERRIPLMPHRSVGEVTRDVLRTVGELAGPVAITTTPQEVSWTTPLDRDTTHATYEPAQVATYFVAATHAARVLAEFRATFRGRCSPVNAWWGCMDLGTSLYSGRPADPPSADFIMRNAADAEYIEIGWWPGDSRYGRATFYIHMTPVPVELADGSVVPTAGRWEPAMNGLVLGWDDARTSSDPHAAALAFARAGFDQVAALNDWDAALIDSVHGNPAPIH